MQLLDLMMECEPCKLHDLVHLLGNISLTLNLHPKLAVLSRHCERQGHVSLTEIPKLYKKTSLVATGEHQWESYFCAFNCRGYFCFAEGWRERVGCNCLCWSSLALLKLYSFSCLSHPKEGGQSDFETNCWYLQMLFAHAKAGKQIQWHFSIIWPIYFLVRESHRGL